MSIQHDLPVREKQCQRCGTQFQCGAGGQQGGCWCMDQPIRLPLPKEGDSDCFCPHCLNLIRQQGIHR